MQQLRDELEDFYLRKLSLVERAVSRAGNGKGEGEGAGVGALAAEVGGAADPALPRGGAGLRLMSRAEGGAGRAGGKTWRAEGA